MLISLGVGQGRVESREPEDVDAPADAPARR
jgi:hypothetical protein